jgi:hypothetical protein
MDWYKIGIAKASGELSSQLTQYGQNATSAQRMERLIDSLTDAVKAIRTNAPLRAESLGDRLIDTLAAMRNDGSAPSTHYGQLAESPRAPKLQVPHRKTDKRKGMGNRRNRGEQS